MKPMINWRLGRGVLLCMAGLWLGMSNAHAQSTNAPVTGTDLNSFRLISERNIFNARRSGGRYGGTPRETRRVAVVETITLVGTLETGPDTLAFFDGSSLAFRKALKAGQTIAGHTITRVSYDGVELEAAGQRLDLRVGAGLRREDEGEWKVTSTVTLASNESPSGGNDTSGRDYNNRDSSRGDSRDSRYSRDRESSRRESSTDSAPAGENAGASATATSGSGGGSPEEILRRLMEQREREN